MLLDSITGANTEKACKRRAKARRTTSVLRVLSPDVVWWQSIHLMVRKMSDVNEQGETVSVWSEGKLWRKPEEPEEHLFWYQVGRFVKRT
ncbi:hypothetical protein C8J56DRAFT_915804 [Mycena floridula]|nr:hypothetical protein C8J56DRAFT_915804 [Mycena floridula]